MNTRTVFFIFFLLPASSTLAVTPVVDSTSSGDAPASTAKEVDETKEDEKIVHIKGLDLKLFIPDRWNVTKKRQTENTDIKESQIRLRDSGNAHAKLWASTNHSWYDQRSWALMTIDGAESSYAEGRGWKVASEDWYEMDIDGKAVGVIERKVHIAGNKRAISILYTNRESPNGKQWVMALLFNQGRYSSLEEAIKEMATAVAQSLSRDAEGNPIE